MLRGTVGDVPESARSRNRRIRGVSVDHQLVIMLVNARRQQYGEGLELNRITDSAHACERQRTVYEADVWSKFRHFSPFSH